MTKIILLIVSLTFLFCLNGCSKKEEFSDIKVSVTPENIEKGKSLYMTNCATCHGNEGKGDGPASLMLNPKPRNHTDKVVMDKISDGRMFDVIKKGGVIVGAPMMPANPNLKDDEIKSMIAFIRSISK